jgi:hypothetical protein
MLHNSKLLIKIDLKLGSGMHYYIITHTILHNNNSRFLLLITIKFIFKIA